MEQDLHSIFEKFNPSSLIVTYGLSDAFINVFNSIALLKKITIKNSNQILDVIAIPCFLIIIDNSYLNENIEDYNLFQEEFREAHGKLESLLVIGDKREKPDYDGIKNVKFINQDMLNDIDDLKEIITSAQAKFIQNKRLYQIKNKKLKNIIIVYDYIKKNKQLKTNILSKQIGVSVKTIQRYLNELVDADVGIVYSKDIKKWILIEDFQTKR